MNRTQLIARVIERDQGLCVIAGALCTRTASVVDHRANRGAGGSKILDNPAAMIATCVICNGLKEDADGQYRAELIRRGVRVEKAATNAQTLNRCLNQPVRYPDGRLYFLHSDMTRTEITEPPW